MGKITHYPFHLILLSIIYILAGSINIHRPGLYYDECLFVNAGLGGVNHDCIYVSKGGIPIMVMPYIGALKSWIYYPIFNLLGVSAFTIRFPVILLSCGALLLLYDFIRAFYKSNELALIIFILAATDPAYFFTSRLDWGPNVIANVCAVLSLYALERILATSQTKWFWILGTALCLGLFNKLNFLWFILAFGIASVLFYGYPLLRIVQYQRNQVWAPLLVTAAVFIFISRKLILPLLSTGSSSHFNFNTLSDRFIYTWNNLWGTLSGDSVYFLVTDQHLPGFSGCRVLVLTSMVICLFSFYLKDKAIARRAYFFLVCFLIVYLQIVITHDANGPHHIVALWPFYPLIVCSSLEVSLGILSVTLYKNYLRYCLYVLIGVQILIQIVVYSIYEYTFSLNKNIDPKWSTVIYDLNRYLSASKNEDIKIIMTDWGIENQLFALSPATGRGRFKDFWPTFSDPSGAKDREWVYQTYAAERGALFIVHGDQALVFPQTKQTFLDLMKSHPNISLVKTLSQNNRVIFEIYRSEPGGVSVKN